MIFFAIAGAVIVAAAVGGTVWLRRRQPEPPLRVVLAGPNPALTTGMGGVWKGFTGLSHGVYSIDWGDGTMKSQGAVVGGSFGASHTYSANGTYSIVTTVGDQSGRSASYTDTFTASRRPMEA